MSFEEWVTVAALMLGPLGVALGWWLNELSARNRADRSWAEAQEKAEWERSLECARLARLVAGYARSLAHGIYLTHAERSEPDGIRDAIREYNHARADLNLAVVALRIGGPSLAVGPAESVIAASQLVAKRLTAMQRSLTREDMDAVGKELLVVDARTNELVAALAARYNADHALMPDPIDLDTLS